MTSLLLLRLLRSLPASFVLPEHACRESFHFSFGRIRITTGQHLRCEMRRFVAGLLSSHDGFSQEAGGIARKSIKGYSSFFAALPTARPIFRSSRAIQSLNSSKLSGLM